MKDHIIKEIESEFMRKDIPQFKAGDTVRVYIRIKEMKENPKTKKVEERIRLQPFEGVVIRRRGSGLQETFTVRKVTQGIGIEKIFPIHSPIIEKIDVIRRGKVRRSRIYYIRERRGKAARIKELR